MELYQSLNQGVGGRWVKSDLHVHTPASYDFKRAGLPDDFDYYQYVREIQFKGITLIAVTDHSTGDGIDAMKKAAKDTSRFGRVVVLPGTEIVANNVHLTVIFPETCDGNHVNDFLGDVGIKSPQRNGPNTIASETIEQCIEISHEYGGLAVAAHCLTDRTGLLSAERGQSRMRAIASVDVFEIKPHQDPEKARARAAQLGRTDIPLIVSSDAHCPSELSDDTCWLKMGTPGFHGFKQITLEPDSRVSIGQAPTVTHPRILGLQVTGGLLPELPVRFSAHLNTLIGGRGAGKSAVLDMIRFALGLNTRVATNEFSYSQRIEAFIGNGHSVRLYCVDSQNRVVRIERRGDCQPSRASRHDPAKFDCPPKVSILFEDEFVEVEESPDVVFPIEFYAQGEVLDLTKKATDQLALLDEHIDFGSLMTEEQELLAELDANATALLVSESQLCELEEKISAGSSLAERVAYLESRLSNPIFENRELWADEKSLLDWADSELGQINQEVSGIRTYSAKPCPTMGSKHPNPNITDEVSNLISQLWVDLSEVKNKAAEAIQRTSQRIETLSNAWAVLDGQSEAAFQAALEEADASALDGLMTEKIAKQAQVNEIQSVLLPRLEKFKNDRELDEHTRGLLLENLHKCRGQIRQTRQSQLEAISQLLEGSVKFSLDSFGDSSIFLQTLKSMYAKSGIVGADEQFNKVVNSCTPSELARVLLDGDSKGLSQKTGITTATAGKMVSFGSREDFYALETLDRPDVPTIEMRRSGEEGFTPIERLSYGERCSAILAIALLNKNRPLVIDQPEEELDHEFIIEDIVGGMKRIKPDRQIIVATHNPNIPVLGDAELVMKMSKVPGEDRCQISAQGSLEDKTVLPQVLMLEGGRAAFDKRSSKYLDNSAHSQR